MPESIDIFNIHQTVMDNYKHLDFVVTSGTSSANITEQTKASFLENELENISELNNKFDKIALKRAEILVHAHERFRKVMG